MVPSVLLVVLGTGVAAAAWLFRKSARGRMPVPRAAAVGIPGGALALGLASLVLVFFAPPPRKSSHSANPPLVPVLDQSMPGSYPTAPLAVGDRAPDFEADGWLNGPPPIPGHGGARLVVVDIWAHW
jgi:hypothetical protein